MGRFYPLRKLRPERPEALWYVWPTASAAAGGQVCVAVVFGYGLEPGRLALAGAVVMVMVTACLEEHLPWEYAAISVAVSIA